MRAIKRFKNYSYIKVILYDISLIWTIVILLYCLYYSRLSCIYIAASEGFVFKDIYCCQSFSLLSKLLLYGWLFPSQIYEFTKFINNEISES